ncbi:MAG: hypothetical protein L0G70_06285 [Rubrobacter sp.]|nr:hypothetical protein [Rubrobacter sp.]
MSEDKANRQRRESEREADRRQIKEEMDQREAQSPLEKPSSPEQEAKVVSRPAESQSADEGSVQLLSRMVISNGPWRFFLNFKGIIATAFATGAYALIFPTIWQLSDSISWPRLSALMAISIVVMVFWMIVAHDLWEKSSDTPELDERVTPAMQNAVTLLTLILAVLIAYAVLFGLIFGAAFIFVPDGLLQSTLGHPVDPMNYVILAWVATSISTITGSLGGGLEDSETMREAVNVR